MKSRFALLLLSATTLLALSLAPLAHAQAEPDMGETTEETAIPGEGWEAVYPEAVHANPDQTLLKETGRYLVIRVANKVLHVQPKEIWRDERGIERDGRSKRAFTDNRIYWPNTTVVRAYDHQAMVALLSDYAKSETASLTYTIKLQGRKLASETQRTAFRELEILRLPQSWENIWQNQVTVAPSALRIERVKAFDAAFRPAIENLDGNPDYFSRSEQNAYARFYQEQFNYARNANPNDPQIYRELAEYHESHDNIDAMIGVYLDAVRHELDELEKQRFQLAIGEAMVERLSLFEEAKIHLRAAKGFAAARLLLLRCHFALGENSDAASVADSLNDVEISLLELREGIDDGDVIRRRALLLKARAFLAEHQLGSAEATFQQLLSDAGPEGDEAAWMLASMFVYRGDKGDDRAAITAIESRAAFKDRIIAATTKLLPNQPVPELPYDPLGAKALTIWADAQVDPKFGDAKVLKLDTVTPILDYAALLDPLSADPFLVHGKAREAAQEWAEAEAAYRRGLEIAPDHLGINYRLGVLLQRSGAFDRASERFQRCLRESKNFYHAMNRLAEIAILRADQDKATSLQARQMGNGEVADASLARMMSEMRHGASLFATSLSIEDSQEAVRTQLAEIYCQLADVSESELATSYLNRARVMADRVRRKADADAATRRTAKVTQVTRHELAMVPPLAAHCIYAYASYQLGAQRYLAAQNGTDVTGFIDAERFFSEAQQALDVVELNHDSLFYNPSGTQGAFKTSPAYLWASYWRTRIEVNGRRTRMSDLFDREVSEESFAKVETLQFGWGVQAGDTPDGGIKGHCSVSGGRMTMRSTGQLESGHITRISRVERNDQLASFSIRIPTLGESRADRGIHMTLVSSKGSGNDEQRKHVATLMLGIDADYGIFWEVRSLDKEETRSRGVSLFRDSERVYLDPAAYGGALNALSKDVELGLSRIAVDDGKSVLHSLHVNGWEIPITIEVNRGAMGSGKEIRDFSDPKRLGPKAKFAAYVGVWMRGQEGDTGQLVVEDASWVIDSNLDSTD